MLGHHHKTVVNDINVTTTIRYPGANVQVPVIKATYARLARLGG